MRRLLIPAIILFFCGISFGGANQSKPHSHAEVWLSFKDNYQNMLVPLFKAIEIKHDTRFKESLGELISKTSPLEPYLPMAIYTFAKVGGSGAADKFDKILKADVKFDKTEIEDQIETKDRALQYMHLLKLKPTKTAVEILKLQMMKLKEPKSLLPFASYLKMDGVEFTSKEKDYLNRVITERWNGTSEQSIRILGIQPDWVKLFKTVRSIDKKNLLSMLILCGNEKDRKAYAKTISDFPKVERGLAKQKLLLGASVGDKTAIKRLENSMTGDQAKFISSLPNLYPDGVLLKAEETIREYDNVISRENFLKEFERRGMQEILNKRLNEFKKLMQEIEKMEPSRRQKSYRAIIPFIKYKPGVYLDWLSGMLIKNPKEYGIATRLINTLNMPETGDISSQPEIEDWIRKNPEKIAKAIEVTLDIQRDIYSKASQEEMAKVYGLKPGFINQSRFRLKILPMLFLTDKVFEKYFSKIDERYLDESAILVKDYFGTDWKVPAMEKPPAKKHMTLSR